MSDSKTKSGEEFRIPLHPVSGHIQKRGSQGYHKQRDNRNQNWIAHPNNGKNRGRGRGGGGWQGRGRGRGGGGGNGRFNNSEHQKNFRGNDPAKQGPEKQFNFYCCTCDRGFKTQEQQDVHNTEHIVCGLEGCTFEGHSLVVTKHIRMQHETNLYQRMKNLQTPEDIDKWKEERKKNYPSAKNVTQKEDEFKEKLERREICDIVLPSKRGRGGGRGRGRGGAFSARPTVAPCTFRYPIKRHDERSRSFAEYEWAMRKIEHDQSDQWMKYMFAPDMKARNVRVPFFSMNQSKVVYLENFYMNVTMDKDGKLQKNTKVTWKGFKAKQLDRLSDSESEEEDAEIPISDDEDDMDVPESRLHQNNSQESSTAVQNGEKKQSTTPLGSLTLIDYSSDSEHEEDDIMQKEDDQKNVVQMDSSEQSVSGCRVSIPATQPTVEAASTETIACSSTQSASSQDLLLKKVQGCGGASPFIIEEFTKDFTFKNKPIFSKPHFIRRRKYSRSRLLETLLQDQIRKERNILLQTCRFIRENNFFEEN